MKIETELFKKVGAVWVSQGAATLATATGPGWSNTRYQQLADGEYKVVATLFYNQTNPVPVRANPQTVTSIWAGTFQKP